MFPDCSQSVRLNDKLICCGRRFTTSAVYSVLPSAACRMEKATGDAVFAPCFYFNNVKSADFVHAFQVIGCLAL